MLTRTGQTLLKRLQRALHTMAERDYNVKYLVSLSVHLAYHPQAAVAALNTLQSNFSIIDAIRKSGQSSNEKAIPEMLEFARRIGYQVCGSLFFCAMLVATTPKPISTGQWT
jgi:hypothetical protein